MTIGTVGAARLPENSFGRPRNRERGAGHNFFHCRAYAQAAMAVPLAVAHPALEGALDGPLDVARVHLRRSLVRECGPLTALALPQRKGLPARGDLVLAGLECRNIYEQVLCLGVE